MSITGSSPPPRGRLGERLDPLIMWAGHYFLYFTAAWIALGVANIAAGWSNLPLGYTTDAAVLIWVAVYVADMLRHQQGLCERCITAAPALNPEAALRRWKWALWWTHHRVLRILPSLLYLAWIFGGIAEGLAHPRRGFAEPPWQLAVYAFLLVTLGVVLLISAQHRRLFPWCPWCHWGGGGGDDGSPEPSPLPERPVTVS